MSSKTKTNVTKKEAKPELVPKLRFPEFRGTEGWKSIPLSRLAIRAKQKNRDEKIDRVLTNSAEFGVVDQRDFFDKDIATQGKLEGYFVVELGSYVYNPRISSTAPVGPISKNKIGTGVMSPLYTVFKFKDDRNDFYEHFFKTTGWHAYMRKASSTGARHDRMAISSDDFMAMPLPVPSPNEQQRIAECLGSLDELMAAQARTVDALKTHKKGLMQQLFPREGETQPRLRFPEFQNAGEWVPQSLGSVCSSFSGGTPSTSKPEYYGGDIPFIRSAEIARDRTELFLTPEGLANSAAKMVTKGDVLVALYGANSGDVALAKIDGAINQAILCLKSKKSNAFIYQFLSFVKDWIVATYLQGGQGNLSGEIVKSIVVFFPSPPEQERIASCLSSLDALITFETQKLEALKTHKKGLMQQLFPSPAETTDL